jgi:beta-aspartyl-peptidase (threonine type)
MNRFSAFIFLVLIIYGVVLGQDKWSIAIHGGAGAILRENISAPVDSSYRAALTRHLQHGSVLLAEGANAIDVVEAVVRGMEDDSLFNAGRGAVLNDAGMVELDASIMDGKGLRAGAVAVVTKIRHPVSIARRIMDSTRHVLLAGEGAEALAGRYGLELVPNRFFITTKRLRQQQQRSRKEDYGTVGVVALDLHGNLAAATSTGGTSNKLPGRIGDTPLIGAGTYADNNSCAVSCTGTGEFFIRLGIAMRLSHYLELKKLGLAEAAERIIHDELNQLGGSGGLIAIDKDGEIVTVFNTGGMYRAWANSSGTKRIAIYGNE